MGKRQSTFTGLSRFLPALVQGSTSTEQAEIHDKSKTSPPLTPDASSVLAVLESADGTSHKRKAKTADSGSTSEGGPASKKRKIGLLGPGLEAYDATELVPHYTSAAQVPEHLQKYFAQRTRLFSLYAEGCLLDDEGWYSVTPERVADQIAERCRCDTVLDAFCGVGGNAIAFARTCQRVIALDTSPIRLALARHNAAVYGVADRIEFILADYVSFARSYATTSSSPSSSTSRKIDVVFLSPPWGGPDYIADSPVKPRPGRRGTAGEDENAETDALHGEYSLSRLRPLSGEDLFHLARRITPNVAYFLPRNTSLTEVVALLDREAEADVAGDGKAAVLSADGVIQPDSSETTSTPGKGKQEQIEVEEEWMGSKLKALTCYFGGLVAGQEALFDA